MAPAPKNRSASRLRGNRHGVECLLGFSSAARVEAGAPLAGSSLTSIGVADLGGGGGRGGGGGKGGGAVLERRFPARAQTVRHQSPWGRVVRAREGSRPDDDHRGTVTDPCAGGDPIPFPPGQCGLARSGVNGPPFAVGPPGGSKTGVAQRRAMALSRPRPRPLTDDRDDSIRRTSNAGASVNYDRITAKSSLVTRERVELHFFDAACG